MTWPAVPLLPPVRGQFLLTTRIGFAVKAAKIRRDARVSLLFSDPTGSDLVGAPAVLLQGRAGVADGFATSGPDLEGHWRLVRSRQPASRRFSRTAPARWFMAWYFMRLLSYVTPGGAVVTRQRLRAGPAPTGADRCGVVWPSTSGDR